MTLPRSCHCSLPSLSTCRPTGAWVCESRCCLSHRICQHHVRCAVGRNTWTRIISTKRLASGSCAQVGGVGGGSTCGGCCWCSGSGPPRNIAVTRRSEGSRLLLLDCGISLLHSYPTMEQQPTVPSPRRLRSSSTDVGLESAKLEPMSVTYGPLSASLVPMPDTH